MILRGISQRIGIRSLSTIAHSSFLPPKLSSQSPEAKRPRLADFRMASTSAGDYGNFKQLSSFDIKYAPVKVGKWRSEKTGLSVVVGSYEGPITNGHFVVASEIFDDTGRPHTLEHLVFLGSKSYPFKGVLDTLANRASSNGTNAWTASDHTAYTIATAGTAGFLKMLPIYVDHILHPTITDAGYVTEVHHVNGQGEDAGVVYSEMQARENTAGDLMTLNAQRRLYPKSSAYRSETGGLLSALRALDAQQIRDYHKAYYVPHNLCLVIDGAVSLPELFKVLNEEVEPMILDNMTASAEWKRPFVETTTSKSLSIAESSTQVVEFMEEDESMGDIVINWLGPPPMDYTTNLALSILNKYLTNSATAPLQKEFVEIAKPYCTGISFYAEDRVNKNELSCFISDVPMKHLDKMRDMLMAKLVSIKKEGIDMEKMALQIRRDKRKLLDGMEKGVSGTMADCAIGDFLYGDKNGKDLPAAFEDLRDYEVITAITEKGWIELLDKYYISQPCLTTIGQPSAILSAKIEQDEKDRLAKRKEELGEEQLAQLQKALDAAKEESDRPPPSEMITDFPLTDPKTLTWVPVETAINAHGEASVSDRGEVQKHVDADGSDLPYQAHFSHVKSNFITVSALFDTIAVPSHLKPYFAIFQAALFASSVKRSDGSVLTHEQVVDQLDDFTIDQNAYFSFRGRLSEVFVFELKVEKAEYEKAIGWMKDLLTGLVFAQDRLEVIVAKLLQELPYEKRDGAKVADVYLYNLAYDNAKSTSEACSLLSMLEFLPAIALALKEEPGSVIQHLEEVRQYLLDPSIMRVSVRGDVLGLLEPRSALARAFLSVKAGPLSPLSTAKDTLSEIGKNPSKKCIIVSMPAIEGSYSAHYAKGPSGWQHPDLPALTLAVSVLNATESYLWKAVRGSGLAYGASVSASAETGLTSYSVYRSPNAKLAYEEAGRVLVGLVDGTIELDQTVVDGARSSLTYSYARGSETVGAAAGTAYLDEILKGVGKDQNKKMLETFPTITLADIRRAIKLYLLPIFSSDTSICAVTVSSGKADEVEQGFKDLGFETERKSLPALGGESEDGSGSEGGGSEGSEI